MGIKFRIHPLFFAFGFFYAFSGKILIFIIYTLTDFLHEIGHSIVAERQGYRLNKITLMPFGAVVSGELNGMNVKDELKIAIAGPITNFLIAIFFISLWWIYPTIYAYTDLIVEANVSLAVINLLPFFPLDGGRILLSILSKTFKREKALRFCKIFGVTGGTGLLVLFIITIFNEINFSLLFFSLFIIFGAVSNDKENKYIKIFTCVSERKLKHGVEYKKIAVDKDITIKKLISLIDANSINEVVIFENGEEKKSISQKEIENLIAKSNIYSKISEVL